VETTARQIRAAEADLTVLSRYGSPLLQNPTDAKAIEKTQGIKALAPFVEGVAVITPQLGAFHGIRRDSRDDPTYACSIDGVDWQQDEFLGRKPAAILHPPPDLDLKAPIMKVDGRGSAFLTPSWRTWLALKSLEISSPLGGSGLLPLPPALKPVPGAVLGRELIYHCGGLNGPLTIGMPIRISAPNGTGGRTGVVNAEVSDTFGVGAMEIDRYQTALPLPIAQQLFDMDGRHPGRNGQREISGWRVGVTPECSLAQGAANLRELNPSWRVETWQQRRGHIVKSLEIMRNIMVLVMILVQCISVFIIAAVFSTLVAEKRHDIGTLLGLGASPGSIQRSFVWASLAISLFGGLAGWVLGWTLLTLLNPVSEILGFPLFPQAVMYTPQAPISYDPIFPLIFIGVAVFIGFISALLPAWRASRIDPIETLRDNG
jgi:ABC-type lipoprotein release transport system permease subunit